MNKSIVFIPLLALAGCVPYPQVEESSPAVRGRVVNAKTQTPIAGARVMIEHRPLTAVKTNAAGAFSLPAHYHLNLWMTLGMCASVGPDWPEYCSDIEVSHEGYMPSIFHISDGLLLRPQPKGDAEWLKDVKLKPMPITR